jgi:hypothetical protein
LELLSFDPASVGSAILEVDDHQPDPIGVASQLLCIKCLLSAPIDALVRDFDAVRQILEEIKPQLPEVLQIKLWPTGHLPFSTPGSPSNQALANRTPPFLLDKSRTGSAKD